MELLTFPPYMGPPAIKTSYPLILEAAPLLNSRQLDQVPLGLERLRQLLGRLPPPDRKARGNRPPRPCPPVFPPARGSRCRWRCSSSGPTTPPSGRARSTMAATATTATMIFFFRSMDLHRAVPRLDIKSMSLLALGISIPVRVHHPGHVVGQPCPGGPWR